MEESGKVVLDFQVGDGRGWRTRRGRAGQQQGTSRAIEGSSVDRGRRKDAWPCAGLFTRVWSAAWAPTSEQSERRRAGAKKRQDRRPELGPSRSNRGKWLKTRKNSDRLLGTYRQWSRAASELRAAVPKRLRLKLRKLGFEPERGAARGVEQSHQANLQRRGSIALCWAALAILNSLKTSPMQALWAALICTMPPFDSKCD